MLKALLITGLSCAAAPCGADALRPDALTAYAARISAEPTWHDVLRNPFSTHYTDAYLFVGALSHEYASRAGGALRIEFEGNVAYNFGAQRHLEFNVAPIVVRWQRFPWSHRVATSAAFGLGLSYATDRPEVELALEHDTQRLLAFWLLELTAGKPDSPWSFVLRLHHRSPVWGLMGVEDGGMNAPGIGFRYLVDHAHASR